MLDLAFHGRLSKLNDDGPIRFDSEVPVHDAVVLPVEWKHKLGLGRGMNHDDGCVDLV